MNYSGIYAIVDDTVAEPVAFCEALLNAGVAVLQYRAKRGVDANVLRALHARTQLAHAILLVNDDLDAALTADGWHAGPEDLAGRDMRAVRAALGDRMFGISAGTAREARAAEDAGANYIGVGPFAATATKSDAGPPLGLAGLRAVVVATRLPVVAIGGIGPHNLAQVAASGAAMAAVISALTTAPDPGAAARAMIAAWKLATA